MSGIHTQAQQDGDGPGAERLQLSRHAALKSRHHGDVLVLPERAIRLGGSGGEILRLFDRPRTTNEAAAELRARYPANAEIAAEVGAFVARMRALDALIATSPDNSVAIGTVDRAIPLSSSTARDLVESESVLESTSAMATAPAPLNLIAELTYRCPLQCPYCSNPIDFRSRREALDADAWGRVFEEAAELGVVHLGLTGGEPSTRADLEQILAHAAAADLYPHLVTAARPLTSARLDDLAARGLRSVQVSLQAVDAELTNRIAGTVCFEEKLEIARHTVELGLALTINCVLHRHNLEQVPRMIELALELGADRLELANTQFHSWALENRAALMPSREQLETANAAVRSVRAHAASQGLTVLFVLPDYYAGRPKPCMGGWGRLALVVDPTGLVLPCHDSADLPGLEFWRLPARTLRECWEIAPGMQAFRGTDWMPEPCQSCPERERDFAGCRCQAFRLLGDAARTDPACSLSPDHGLIVAARDERRDEFVFRR